MINYDAMIAQAQDSHTQIGDLKALAVGALTALKEMDAEAKELAYDDFYELPSFFSYFAEDYTKEHLEKFVEEIDEVEDPAA